MKFNEVEKTIILNALALERKNMLDYGDYLLKKKESCKGVLNYIDKIDAIVEEIKQ